MHCVAAQPIVARATVVPTHHAPISRADQVSITLQVGQVVGGCLRLSNWNG